MKQIQNAAMLVSLIVLGGCVEVANKLPGKAYELPQTPSAPAQTEYDILGDVEGSASRTVVFGIPSDLFVSHAAPGVAVQGLGSGGPFQWFSAGGLSKVEKEAAYDALQKFPNADGLILVRTTHYEKRNYLLFTTYEATIKGRAIKIKGMK